ncbi:MAG: hypothetical protein C4518_14645 [Desulfobacteraceae bacterium]|nr:MAG: hypothetical protein C4518_14645 [Desulfobacteraceae bacterium]
MIKSLKKDSWVFVAVQDPGGNEHFLGLYDQESDVSFIPIFKNKEDAQSCLVHLPTQKGAKYEVQAIIFEDLAKDALNNNFVIFLLDGEGKILEKDLPYH